MIKPTVGRVVWFWPGMLLGGFGGFCNHGAQPCAAMVAYVWNDRMVNLQVLDHNGVAHNFTSVSLLQEGDPRPERDFCEWMPYQIGQAKAQTA